MHCGICTGGHHIVVSQLSEMHFHSDMTLHHTCLHTYIINLVMDGVTNCCWLNTFVLKHTKMDDGVIIQSKEIKIGFLNRF